MKLKKEIKIDETNIDLETVVNNCIYSITEKKIGKYVDGKPLYQKVAEAIITSHQTIRVYGFFSNVDTLASFTGAAKESFFGYPFYYKSNDDTFLGLRIADDLEIQVGSTFPSVPFKAVVTIKYTKTTD